jgi:hypothetical protein
MNFIGLVGSMAEFRMVAFSRPPARPFWLNSMDFAEKYPPGDPGSSFLYVLFDMQTETRAAQGFTAGVNVPAYVLHERLPGAYR